jgi:hypothetical protein
VLSGPHRARCLSHLCFTLQRTNEDGWRRARMAAWWRQDAVRVCGRQRGRRRRPPTRRTVGPKLLSPSRRCIWPVQVTARATGSSHWWDGWCRTRPRVEVRRVAAGAGGVGGGDAPGCAAVGANGVGREDARETGGTAAGARCSRASPDPP